MEDREIKGMIGLGQLFPLGTVVTTPAFMYEAEATLGERRNQTTTLESVVLKALKRHVCGDWGELDEEDRLTNNDALREGERLISAYSIKGVTPDRDLKFWIITEWDRSVTTVLLPSDY